MLMSVLRYICIVLDSTIDRGEWLASRFGRFNPCAHSVGDWMGLRAGLDATEKRNISFLRRELNTGRAARRNTD
jgi:hypothetical protein